MRKIRKPFQSRKAIAAVLCVCMVSSAFSGYTLVARGTSGPGGATEGVTREADPSTMDDYMEILDLGANTRYAGRLWSDKSVFACGAEDTGDRKDLWDGETLRLDAAKDGGTGQVDLDSDFLHVYSVLGSSLQADEPIPADLVLALDISGSMSSPLPNEGPNWINTADPTDPETFTSIRGLGFYSGDKDTGLPSDVMTDVPDETQHYEGSEGDANKIPDSIVPVLPVNSYAALADGGQMDPTYVKAYDEYLGFCNALADALVTAETNGSIEGSVGTIRTRVQGDKRATAYLNKYSIAGLQAADYRKIYTAYQNYLQVFEQTGEKHDPWLSDNSYEEGCAVWPDAGWDAAMKTARPAHPMQTASNAPNRMYYLIDAANDFIDQYLSMNKRNRIAIVVYDSVATVLMPLAHYDKVPGKDYLSAEKHHWQSWGQGQWACTINASAMPRGGYEAGAFRAGLIGTDGTYHASVTSWSNTGTSVCLNAGLDILANASDTYQDLDDRMPMLVLMTDGAANIAMTGLGEDDASLTTSGTKTLSRAWTKGSEKSVTGQTSNVKDTMDGFNGHDGMVLRNRSYATLNGSPTFRNKTSDGLAVYGAGYGHIYGSENDANIRYTVVLNTLMSTAYQKTLVEKHYNGDKDYPSDKAGRNAWTDASIYTIGFGLEYYNSITQGVCADILDPASNFNEGRVDAMPIGTSDERNFKAAFSDTLAGYRKWHDWEAGDTGDGSYTQSFFKSGTSAIDGLSALASVTLQFPITQNDLRNAGTSVTKDDIDRNIRYNKAFYTAALEGTQNANDQTLEDVFNDILALIQNEVFKPVGGANDLGVENAVTYVDTIGKYMEVRDVKNVLLFGDLLGVHKTAIYDYSFNDAYMREHGGQRVESFENGWYRKDPDGSIEKAAGDASWDDGWEYYVNTETAERFLPTESDLAIEDPREKILNTKYTFYRLELTDEERAKLRMNPAYGETDPETLGLDTEDPDAENYYSKTPGVYRLSDLRIWTEDLGDYVDETLTESGTLVDTDYEMALYVNLPVNMMPLRKVVISSTIKGGDLTYSYLYTSNLEDPTANAYKATFPMRVFYTVGMQDSVLAPDGTIDVKNRISREYALSNKISTTAAAKGRNLEAGDLEFLSTWYNPTNRYSGYVTTETDYTYGNPVVSFSPDSGNKYYIFDNASAIYSKAYAYRDGTWREIRIGGDGEDPDTFGGRLLASNLEVIAETPDGIKAALGERQDEARDGDVVLLANALIADSRLVHRGDTFNNDFTSADYYFITLDYFELDGNSGAKKVSYAVTRKGAEFGSAYGSVGLGNGELLCWYDLSERYGQTYPYLSATETGVYDRGLSHIGLALRYDEDGKPLPVTAYTQAERNAAKAVQAGGNWVIAARKNGLRVSDMAKDVKSKGGGYADYGEDFVSERYEGQEGLTWRYNEGNVTRTSNNYYLPTISVTKGTGTAGSSAIINSYLGNNGRLYFKAFDALPEKTETRIHGKEDHVPAEGDFTEGDDGSLRGPIVQPGNEITYEILWENYKPEDAAVTVKDKLDPNVTFVSASFDPTDTVDWKGNPLPDAGPRNETLVEDAIVVLDDNPGSVIRHDHAAGQVTWDLGVQPAGARGKVTLTVKAKDTATNEGEVTNIGLLQVNNDPEQETRAVTNPVPSHQKAETSPGAGTLVKTDDTVEYQIHWRNYENGPSRILILDTLDPGVTFRSAENGGQYYETGGTIPAAPGQDEVQVPERTVAWILENQAAGAEGTVSLSVTVNQDARKGYAYDDSADGFAEGQADDWEIANQARVKVNGDAFIKTGIVVNGVTGKTETEILRAASGTTEHIVLNAGTHAGPTASVGDVVTYRIAWSNGHDAAVDVRITDRLDDGLDFVSADGGGTYDGTTRTVTWDLPGRIAHTNGTVTVKARINDAAAEAGTVANAADLKVGDDPVVETETIQNSVPRFEKTETAPGEGTPVTDGDTVDYRIAWRNPEGGTADVTITDPLDPDVAFLRADNGGTYDETDHAVTWTLKGRPAGDEGTVTLSVTVRQDAETDHLVTNQATLKVGNEPERTTRTIENPMRPEKTEIRVNDRDVSNDLAKTEDGIAGPRLDVNDAVTYRITWQNDAVDETGTPLPSEVTVTDTLDPGMDFLSADGGGTYDGTTRTVTWELGEQPARKRGTVTLQVRVNADAGTRIENQAAVQIGNRTAETNRVRNDVRPTGSLKITKTVTGEGDRDKDWHFTVTLDDTGVNGTYGGMGFAAGIADVTLRHGDSVTAGNLPAGTSYTITEAEANQDGYVTASEHETGTIAANRTDEALFTNHKEPAPKPEEKRGNLRIAKTVTGDGDKDMDWNFRILLDDTTVNGIYGGLTFKDGVADTTLRHGDTVTAAGLPAGIGYTVIETEADKDGYVTGKTDDTGTIPENGTAKAEFVNHREPEPLVEPKTGSLAVTKTVTGDGDKDRHWHFVILLGDTELSGDYGDLTFTDGKAECTLKHGDSITAADLPAGTAYAVTEIEAGRDGYRTSVTKGNGTIPEDGTVTAAFINGKDDEPIGKKQGSLSVSKTVTGDGDQARDWNFTVILDDSAITGTYGDLEFVNGIAGFTLRHGETRIANGLPEGTAYTVTEAEADKDGYATETIDDIGLIREDGIAEAEFTNRKEPEPPVEPKTGSLAVTKNVTGEGDPERDFTFTVTLRDTDLDGAYGGLTFADGKADFTLRHGETVTATGLPEGTLYTVTEAEANTEGYETSITGGNGLISAHKTAQATFTNHKEKEPEYGDLRVSKTVTGEGDTEKDWNFRIALDDDGINGTCGDLSFTDGKADFTLRHGETVTAANLPAGIRYQITEREADQDGYVTAVSGNTGTITADTVMEARFTNHKEPKVPDDPEDPKAGSLDVTKTVVGDGKDVKWHFTVTVSDTSLNGTYGDMVFTDGTADFTLRHGETVTADGLPAGTAYEIMELEAGQDGYTTNTVGTAGEIRADETARAAFTNVSPEVPPEERTGTLTVKKTITGDGDKDAQWHFTVTLDDGDLTGTYGGVAFENGMAELTLSHGQSVTLTDLPAGAAYAVTEEEADRNGYITTSENETGTIQAYLEQNVSFVNHKPVPNDEPKDPVPGGDKPGETPSGGPDNPDKTPAETPAETPVPDKTPVQATAPTPTWTTTRFLSPDTWDNHGAILWGIWLALSLAGTVASGTALLRTRRKH